jgi:hypothetical protein
MVVESLLKSSMAINSPPGSVKNLFSPTSIASNLASIKEEDEVPVREIRVPLDDLA